LRRFWSRARAADLARAGVDPAQLDVGIRQIVELRVAQMAGEVIGATKAPVSAAPALAAAKPRMSAFSSTCSWWRRV
jgi:pimeloyl-ACP methyl ester carboxylesterase